MDSNFIEDGFRPPTEVRDNFTPDIFKNPTNEARIHFFKSEGNQIPELQRVIQATVLVSEGAHSPGASGVIINFEGKKYLVTATHVIGNLLAGEYGKEEMKYHYRNSKGVLQDGILRRGQQLYDSTTAMEKGLEAIDSAIFPFEGDNEGVEISDLEVGYNANQVGSSIGFPAMFQNAWKNSIKPLISVGYVSKGKPKEVTPYMRELLKKHGKEQDLNERNLTIFYTGRIVRGNSGGPLVDNQGKVMGVCSGPKGTLGKESGIERFSDFRPILKGITQRAA